MKGFVIPFVGLSKGVHKYEFDIRDSFWSHFENSLITNSDARAEVVLQNQETMLLLEFELYGTIRVPCDRCLEEFDLPLHTHNRLIIKFGDQPGEESDEVVVLARGEHELDISQYIYEFFNLSMPMRRVHPENEDGSTTCDSEVMNRLYGNLHNEVSSENTDERWSALKNLFNKN